MVVVRRGRRRRSPPIAPVAWFWLLRPYQKDRILTFLDPESDPLGAGWNIIQSKIAIGGGGLTGKGWGEGTQSHLDYLPEHTTDFIFAVLSEEFGWVGVAVVLALYLFVSGAACGSPAEARDGYSRLLAGALGLAFFVYVIVNGGMISGLLPVVGVPMPLLSYGGTSAVSLLAGLGVVMAVRGAPPGARALTTTCIDGREALKRMPSIRADEREHNLTRPRTGVPGARFASRDACYPRRDDCTPPTQRVSARDFVGAWRLRHAHPAPTPVASQDAPAAARGDLPPQGTRTRPPVPGTSPLPDPLPAMPLEQAQGRVRARHRREVRRRCRLHRVGAGQRRRSARASSRRCRGRPKAKPWRDYRPIFISPARIERRPRLHGRAPRCAGTRRRPAPACRPRSSSRSSAWRPATARNTGSYPVLDALYTLAFAYPRTGDPAKAARENRREAFFRGELAQLFALGKEQQPGHHHAQGQLCRRDGLGPVHAVQLPRVRRRRQRRRPPRPVQQHRRRVRLDRQLLRRRRAAGCAAGR